VLGVILSVWKLPDPVKKHLCYCSLDICVSLFSVHLKYCGANSSAPWNHLENRPVPGLISDQFKLELLKFPSHLFKCVARIENKCTLYFISASGIPVIIFIFKINFIKIFYMQSILVDFFTPLEFELRASCLLGKCSTT
jgi:hypothetical protein